MTTQTQAAQAAISLPQRLVLGAVFFVLGAVFVGGIGFAGDYRAHNSAHDSRHAMGFPCH